MGEPSFLPASWIWFGGWIPNAAGQAGLCWGQILGGPLLVMGAVFMIGCEVRTYGRLGLGYGTALAALPGFYVGYLPYTLFKNEIDSMVFGDGLTGFITIPEWSAAVFGDEETFWAVVYSFLLMAILVFSFSAARRYFRVRMRELLVNNTDDLIEKTEKTRVVAEGAV